MSNQAHTTEHDTILLDRIDSLKATHNKYISEFEAELSRLRDEAVLETRTSVKTKDTWLNEKASLQAQIGALQAGFKAQEEKANVAHQVCKVCSKQRDDALKAGADLAHSLSAANYVTEEAVNRYAVADQTAKAALKESEDLKRQVRELQSLLHGAQLVADDKKGNVAKLQERLAKTGKGKAILEKEKEEQQAKLSASTDTFNATERRLAVEESLQEQQRLMRESTHRELELQQQVEVLRKAREALYDEQDLTHLLGQAEDAQAAAEQGWSDALRDVDILWEFITANELEVPDCHTQYYDDDAEVTVPTSQEVCATINTNPPPSTNWQASHKGIASFAYAGGTGLLPEVASSEIGHMPQAGGISEAADTVTPEAAGCGSADVALVDDPGAGFETVKARRKPKSENLPQDKMQSGSRPSHAQSIAKPSGTATVLVVPRPASHSSTKPSGTATVLVVPRPAFHSSTTTDVGDHISMHKGGNAAADRSRTSAMNGRTDSSRGFSQSRSGRGGFRQGRGDARCHVNRSRVLEVPRHSPSN